MQVLPTESGAYPFKCNTFADFKVASDTALVHSELTDTCTPSDGKCEARGARCVQGQCACVDERHPLRLRSVHTVCWPKVRLGGHCYFQVHFVSLVYRVGPRPCHGRTRTQQQCSIYVAAAFERALDLCKLRTRSTVLGISGK